MALSRAFRRLVQGGRERTHHLCQGTGKPALNLELHAHHNISKYAQQIEVLMHKQIFDSQAAKRAVNLTLNGDLVKQARAAGLNLSALAEEAVAVALTRRAREKLMAEIAKGCEVHELYLAEYGSLGDAVRANADAAK